MTHIIGYAYEADLHCVDCAKKRFQARNIDAPDYRPSDTDQHHIPYGAVDRERNAVHPIFDTDEANGADTCGDCFIDLRG